jgi:hypothetical protein
MATEIKNDVLESGRRTYRSPLSGRGAASSHTDLPEWRSVLRVVNSAGFSKSALLSNFLQYVCERKLLGRETEITEQQIGIQAFGRPAGYNPGDDNIVRNYARILRQRLEHFYNEEGCHEPIRIVIRRGSYVPSFEAFTEPATTAPSLVEANAPQVLPALVGLETIRPAVVPTHPTELRRELMTRRARWVASFVVLLLLAGGCGIRRVWLDLHPDAYTEFWNEILPQHRSTVVVPADSGLGIIQGFTDSRIRLHEYASGDFTSIAKEFAIRYPGLPFGLEQFKNLTSTADVHCLLSMAALPQFAAAKLLVRSAQDVHMDDLSNANAIIVGGPRANPWVELYEPLSEFRLDTPVGIHGSLGGTRVVVNKRPGVGERATYPNRYQAEEGYVNHSILSFLPSPDGHGHALLFQGGDMGATQAAADFATDRLSIEPILRKARLPDGSIRPFEVLLETRVIGASSPKATVLLIHYR